MRAGQHSKMKTTLDLLKGYEYESATEDKE